MCRFGVYGPGTLHSPTGLSRMSSVLDCASELCHSEGTITEPKPTAIQRDEIPLESGREDSGTALSGERPAPYTDSRQRSGSTP